jgi:hypothetical protein
MAVTMAAPSQARKPWMPKSLMKGKSNWRKKGITTSS